MSGWPANRSNCHPHVQVFSNYWDEIGLQDGILLKGNKIIIPLLLQPDILQQLHSSHQGVEKTCLLAWTAIFWVGINKDIEELIGNCSTCQKYQPSIPSETLHTHETPSYPWQYVSTDIFTIEDKEFLPVVDHYTRSHFIRHLHLTTPATIIRQMKLLFEEWGIPEVVYSDNGPQYSSSEFANFAKSYNFRHTTSSSHHPQLNDLPERMVGICKRLLMRAWETNTDSHLAMMAYRATPLSAQIKSPAELLNGRPMRTPLVSKQQLGDEQTKVELEKSKEETKKWYDQKNRYQHPQLPTGPLVHVQDKRTRPWESGKIVQIAAEPRTYLVKLVSGVIHRRNKGQSRQHKVPAPTENVLRHTPTSLPSHHYLSTGPKASRWSPINHPKHPSTNSIHTCQTA